MADTSEISVGDFSTLENVLPSTGNKPVNEDEMTLATNYANLMKQRGVSDADVETFLKVEAEGQKKPAQTQEMSIDQFSPTKPIFSDVTGGSSTRGPTLLDQANKALASLAGHGIPSPLGYIPNPEGTASMLANYGKDIANVFGEAGSYIANFGQEHTVREPGVVTPEEKRAIDLMGIPVANNIVGGDSENKVQAAQAPGELTHPSIYTLTEQQRQAIDDTFLKKLGLNPEQERKRATAFAEGRLDENADPIANITVNNTVGSLLQDLLNPKMAATRQYEAIQQTVAARKILSTPLMHTEQEVAAAQELVDHYKAVKEKGVVENTKDLLDEIKANPGSTMWKFAAQLEQDPELAFLSKARVGTLLNEAKIAELTANLKKAQEWADFAARTGMKITPKMPAEDIVAGLKGAKKAEVLGNIASEPFVGGMANVILDTQAQTKEQGYVTPGSQTTPFVQGAALGTTAALGEATRLLPKRATKPGEPLPSETPVVKGGNVPLAAGVDASGKVIHVDENMPDTLPMKNMNGEDVNVHAKNMVAWHESVEFPLMHLEGPMAPASIVELLKKVQGQGTIPKDVLAKLKKGESLSYDEAHNIATMAENARVRSVYGVDPKVYQNALKPYIKQAADDSKSAPADSIPANLDTKPYTESGEVASLKGQGATPADREALAKGIQFGKKALGAAGVAAGGAAIGVALSDEDKGKGALVGAAFPLLGRILREEDIPETSRLPREVEHIQAARAGNQQAIANLYNHYMPRLTKVMDRYMREAGPRLGLAGEDIAQRAFLKAIQALPEFKGDSSFYTWLYRIGVNEAKNAITDAGREVPTESMFKAGEGGSNKPGALSGQVGFGGDETGSEPIKPSVQGAAATEDTPEALNAGHQISQLVRQVMTTLPKNMAEVLRLRYLDGLTDVETARALNMNVSTVKVTAMRGQERLAQAFKGTETEKLFKQVAGSKQGGFVDPELLKRLAKFAVLASGGAALGANYFDPQHPYKSMVQGASLALMAGQVKWSNLFKKVKDSMHYDPRIDIRDQLNQYDWDIARGDRLVAQTRYAVDGLVKTEAERVNLAKVLGGENVPITSTRALQILRAAQDTMNKEALGQGLTQQFLINYINRAWEDGPAKDTALKQIQTAFKKKTGQPPISLVDQLALIKKYTSLMDGKALGLKPTSEDANVLIGHHIDSLIQSMANRNLIESLKNTPVPGSKGRLVMPASKAPYSYVVGTGLLSRYKMHPSIAPSIDFLHKATGGSAATLALESANTALKRVQVSFSLFHAKSLLDAFAGAAELTHPWRNFVDAALSVAGKDRGHEAYLKGDVGDDVDHLIRALKITPRRGNVPVEDVTSGFYDGLKVLQDALDSTIKGSGKQTVGRAIQLSRGLDHLLWENLHSGLKLVVAMNALERLRRSYAKDIMKNPMAQVPSLPELADRAANFTNDIFGGLNWRRIADDAKTQWGHGLGHALTNPEARRIGQIMIFAPDWTYSTVRSVVKAIGKGSGFSGLLRPKEIADLHRLYIMRSALIYFTLYNGINMALSGHPIYENQRNGKPEPFMVDLGNGEWAQANKHAMEVPNMVVHPVKWALGKLGNIPSEIMEQALGKEYLSPDYMPPMKEGKIAHAAKRLLPFSGTSLLEQGPKEAIASALGVPVYGHTEEQKAVLKAESKAQFKARKEAKNQQRIESLLGGGK